MKYTDTEIRDLYNSYDEVLDRICVLNTIIRSPESTFGQVNMAKAERERLIPRKRELEKKVNLVEKLFRLQFTSQTYVQEILTGSPKIFARETLCFMKESDYFMVKKYYAYVAPDFIDFFEEKLRSFGDKVKSIERDEVSMNSDGALFYPYVIEAEEGIINPKWEVSNKD